MVMDVVDSRAFTYDKLKTTLTALKNDSSTATLLEYCGGSPVIIGYLSAHADSHAAVPNLERQTQDNSVSIWIRMMLNNALSLKLGDNIVPAPVLKSIHCCGVRHATATQIILYEDIDSEKLQYYSRSPPGILSKRPEDQFLPQENSELDYALHQVNSVQTLRDAMYDRLGSTKEGSRSPESIKLPRNQLLRCVGNSFASVFMIMIVFSEMFILVLSTPLPSYLPLLGGLALREVSALAHVLDLRLRTLCHLPIAIDNSRRSRTKFEPTPVRSRLHFDAYSKLAVILIDIIVGLVVGLVLFNFSSRSAFVLRFLHRGFNILHMDVLTESTVWLMGVPAGLKLNVKLTEWLGTNVLAVLDLWNLVTTQLAALEPTIVILIGSCGALGSSFVLAVLVDLVHCVTAHILLIYFAFAKVHAFMLYAISSLSYLFRGKKRNVLRRRIDTLVCSLEQLLLGTLMFTMLVFLFPTFAVYYVFFFTVWITILGFQAILWICLAVMTTVPFYGVALHSLNPLGLPGAIRLEIVHTASGRGAADYDAAYLKLRGVPCRVFDLFRLFSQYLAAWYVHYTPVRILKACAVGEFIKPLPFLLKSQTSDDELPSTEETRRVFNSWFR